VRTLVVIPSKDLESTVGDVVSSTLALDLELDVLVVDDGSTDGTSSAARRAGAEVVRHTKNLGKGAALKTGFDYAIERGYEAVVTMDGDGQHDPQAITCFLDALELCGADIVVGSRMHAVGDMPGIRIWTNRTTSRIVSLLARQEIPDSQSGFRIIRTRLLEAVSGSLVTTRYDTESELLIRAGRRGFRVAAVPIRSIYTGGVSHINPVVDTLRFLRLVGRSLFWR
jgi:glycosyltransferase involved in cell wall biosynthesis